MAALSVGNPATFLRTLEQHQKSWYMLLFQFPGIAERWLTEDNRASFRAWSQHPDADQMIAELEANGSLTPGLNWYRANVPPQSGPGRRCSFRRCKPRPWASGARGTSPSQRSR